jgi:integrase
MLVLRSPQFITPSMTPEENSESARKEAAEKLAKAMADREGGLVFDANELKVGEYLDRWLKDAVKDTVRQRTWEGYEHLAKKHIAPVLGCVKLKNLTPTHVRGLYREKLDAGLSPRIIQYIHVTLKKALSQAVEDGLYPATRRPL